MRAETSGHRKWAVAEPDGGPPALRTASRSLADARLPRVAISRIACEPRDGNAKPPADFLKFRVASVDEALSTSTSSNQSTAGPSHGFEFARETREHEDDPWNEVPWRVRDGGMPRLGGGCAGGRSG